MYKMALPLNGHNPTFLDNILNLEITSSIYKFKCVYYPFSFTINNNDEIIKLQDK